MANPDPRQLEAFLAGLRQHESGNRNVPNAGGHSTASGYYQYINGTWNNYGGYRRAMDAPFAVQHQRARQDVLRNYRRYGGDWEKVAAAHFYPALANNKAAWGTVPGRGNPPIRKFVNSVLSHARRAGLGGTGARPATGPAAVTTPVTQTPRTEGIRAPGAPAPQFDTREIERQQRAALEAQQEHQHFERMMQGIALMQQELQTRNRPIQTTPRPRLTPDQFGTPALTERLQRLGAGYSDLTPGVMRRGQGTSPQGRAAMLAGMDRQLQQR